MKKKNFLSGIKQNAEPAGRALRALTDDEVAQVSGGIWHRELYGSSSDGGYSVYVSTSTNFTITCPKCYKEFNASSYPNDTFQSSHVDFCQG